MNGDIRSYRGIEPQIGEHVYIDSRSVIVGDVHIGEHSSVWPLVAARGDVNQIRIGARTNVQDNSVLHVSRSSEGNPEGHPLIIGDDVTVGHHVMLHGCSIGNRVLIGMSAVIMDGAIIEDDVIIGAGSLVPPGKTLRSGYLYVGSPVKEARQLTEAERNFLPQSAANYVLLKEDYLLHVTSI
ncbi:gamma carbonic anhydrase family protein [Pseudidiomarina donghaiensis]|uniref:Gamma carbonic anhydrase family protein n=1 Tax=Pseudidiomarina donghaiensis TaxID=519452 RepID=A0A432XGD1_9GAMM|nr:gamma carbonic anhydrase family protein [Pseudidiomarina donghaiensis]RUO47829.1 gamma carbonic anhydrase family protein [Pseudidiomarina donghaiensis]SFV22389.1 Carbonic anhydrase or acetyltransferase, isoleucine patch superfamily [Pseudidiomarina donghaiensis]